MGKRLSILHCKCGSIRWFSREHPKLARSAQFRDKTLSSRLGQSPLEAECMK